MADRLLPATPEPNWLVFYIEAMRRHHEVVNWALAFAAEGRWVELIDWLGDSMNNVDAVQPEDIPVFDAARRQAEAIRASGGSNS